ncbi:hypothetical protein ACFYM0_02680 [Streptomyces sp. NPDC006487]|uniref:hypothetical protein n=1 Tax=Streptomyces sp. NPDC006487 TaxID=3364748 RepID=UPI0036B608C3
MTQHDVRHVHGGPSTADATTVPHSCERPCTACPGAPEQAPVCFGHDPERGYFWRCRLCMVLHQGFATEEEARAMLRAHCRLRRVEHCVGAAVRRKRAAGAEGGLDLTRAELAEALVRDPSAGVPST